MSVKNRFKSRTTILIDKYFNKKQLIKGLIFILSLLIISPILLTAIINESYTRRLKTNINDVPNELRNLIVYLPYESIISNDDFSKNISHEVELLYTSKRVDHIYVFSFSTTRSSFPIVNNIKLLFKDIPNELISFNISIKNEFEVCILANQTYSQDKFLIISFKEALIRLNYYCNSNNIYTIGFLPNSIKNLNLEQNSFLKLCFLILSLNDIYTG